MKVIKIKKVFTFWWTKYRVRATPRVVYKEDGFLRPTVVLWLLNGDYLYIGAEQIKEMIFQSDKKPQETDNGLPILGREAGTSTE